LIEEIRLIYDNYGYERKFAASVKCHTMHIVNCAKIGADVMTGPISDLWFAKTPTYGYRFSTVCR
jgi:transaldolase